MNPYNNLQFYNHGGNAMNALAQGMQFGDQLRQQKEQRERQQATEEAYRQAYQGNPDAPNALLAKDPIAAFKLRGSIQEMQAQKEAAVRKQMEQVAQLLDGAVDEASYQQGMAVARQMGLDVAGAPPQFDPEWVAQQKLFTQTFLNEPEKLTTHAQNYMLSTGHQPGTPEFQAGFGKYLAAEQMKTIPYTQGGGVAGYNPMTGEVKTIIAPNDGSQPAGAAVGQPKQPTSKEQYDALPPGSQYVAPDGSVRVKGGSAGNGTGNFQGQ